MDDDISYKYSFSSEDFALLQGFREDGGILRHKGPETSVLRTKNKFEQRQASYRMDVKLGSGAVCGIYNKRRGELRRDTDAGI